MKRYRAYGLTLACGGDLPFAAACSGAEADATIVDALGQAAGTPSGETRRELVRTGEDWSLRYTDAEGAGCISIMTSGRRRSPSPAAASGATRRR
jgi:hypothetical protein